METLFSLLVIAVCMWGCYTLAERKGRNTTIALICGFLFSWIAVIVYALLGTKNKE
jgi:hypothetical protein